MGKKLISGWKAHYPSNAPAPPIMGLLSDMGVGSGCLLLWVRARRGLITWVRLVGLMGPNGAPVYVMVGRWGGVGGRAVDDVVGHGVASVGVKCEGIRGVA